jgi:hypothetical protein
MPQNIRFTPVSSATWQMGAKNDSTVNGGRGPAVQNRSVRILPPSDASPIEVAEAAVAAANAGQEIVVAYCRSTQARMVAMINDTTGNVYALAQPCKEDVYQQPSVTRGVGRAQDVTGAAFNLVLKASKDGTAHGLFEGIALYVFPEDLTHPDPVLTVLRRAAPAAIVDAAISAREGSGVAHRSDYG